MNSSLDDYRRHAAEHGAHTMDGEADACNAAFDRLQELLLSLARAGQRNELFQLYNDDDLSVQCWAAVHTLEVDAAKALAKLEQLRVCDHPLVSMNAEHCIEEWKNGSLHYLPT